jgi:4-amino-4-deoxy-L-arabinose transferase-like glycosyltransferase
MIPDPLRLLTSVPAAAWTCLLVAFLSAACWSFITPPFQVPDEPAHFAYVQFLAETGRLPHSGEGEYSPEESTALSALGQRRLRGRPQEQSIATRAQEDELQRELAAPLSRTGPGDAEVAASEPPLYYALETIPYRLAAGGTLLDRLELMRLLSALMAGVAALFAFLFVREALPGARWAWTVGGLAVAFTPLLGFTSGGVTPDALLLAVSAALFYCFARAFRRGLTARSACAIGAAIGLGTLTKLNFLGLLPGALIGLVLLTRTARGASGRAAYRWPALALAIAGAPAAVYAFVNVVSGHPTLGFVSSATAVNGHHGSLFGEISYIWQLYLPRIPGMPHDFPGFLTIREVWFDGFVGLYGWLDTAFPGWVYDLALLPAALLAGLCARALIASRSALHARLGELLTYVAIGVGVMALVGVGSYIQFPKRAVEYGQARYLLPLLPLLGAALAVAARGAGRRLGPAVGAVIVVLFLGHDIFSQLQTIARYYG